MDHKHISHHPTHTTAKTQREVEQELLETIEKNKKSTEQGSVADLDDYDKKQKEILEFTIKQYKKRMRDMTKVSTEHRAKNIRYAATHLRNRAGSYRTDAADKIRKLGSTVLSKNNAENEATGNYKTATKIDSDANSLDSQADQALEGLTLELETLE